MKYHIRIEGELGQEWADWFGGSAIAREADGVTRLTCAELDQAALHGLLRRLRDLGLPLLSINRIDDSPEGSLRESRDSRPAQRDHRDHRRQIMISEKSAPRLLGAMFLIVIVTSALGGMQSAVTGTGAISDVLVAISSKPAQMQWTALGNLANSLGIVALAVLLYTVLKRQNKILALVALGWWLGEALFCAISQIGAFALVPLSLEFVKAGAPAQSYYQSLGAFLYQGIAKTAYTFLMVFYCTGGIIWYSLFFKSRYIPRPISLFGVAAVCVSLVGMIFELFGHSVSIFVSLPIGLFELSVGVWLLVRGIPGWSGMAARGTDSR
jgi:hypothetical protein